MRASAVLPVVLAAAAGRVSAQEEPKTGELGDAAVVTGNPPGVVYEAVLPDEPFFPGVAIEGNVKGSIIATSAPDGVGVEFKVQFSNLPKEGGPFSYHIHATPVPENGNCTAAQAHLDPYIRGQAIPCDDERPETCEVGDLSGKHGLIDSAEDPFEATYIDRYSSLIEGQGAFFGNRSFVFHFSSNLTRITCANFELKTSGTPLPPTNPDNCTSSSAADSYPQPTAPPTQSEGGDDSGVSSQIPGGAAPTGSIPEPSSTDGFEPVPTAGAAMTAVPFAVLGAAVIAGIFGM
ncbi:cytosolic Cu/Zn superoxide dismutase [Plectosphaerella cucumerina]|uniref:superoxide dismutase n=1 Tax=Plectosphaerella cucumerina TaxID=40658 RepID=A0A8K0TPI0_9PEZI|nr:cytosolic Cu/Zn superoxide dismutase [Plectosphaerella cucumerina]